MSEKSQLEFSLKLGAPPQGEDAAVYRKRLESALPQLLENLMQDAMKSMQNSTQDQLKSNKSSEREVEPLISGKGRMHGPPKKTRVCKWVWDESKGRYVLKCEEQD